MSPLFVVLAIGLVVLLIEVASRALVKLSPRFLSRPIPEKRQFLAEQSRIVRRMLEDPKVRERLHPVRGWEYKDSYVVSEHDQINSQGLRAPVQNEYAPMAAPGIRRIAAFGDSQVFCNEVTYAESWPVQLGRGWRAEVLNYGVGGYATDQAMLRFKEEGARLHPHIVLIGYTSHMAPRIVSRCRRFEDCRDGPWFKPRFVIEGDSLRMIPAPLPNRAEAERLLATPAAVAEFGRNDFWYNPAVFENPLYEWSGAFRLASWSSFELKRRYFDRDRLYRDGVLNVSAEAFRILVRLHQDFANAVREQGAEPTVLLLPTRREVETVAEGGPARYEPLRARLVDAGLRVIDVMPALTSSRVGTADLYRRWGHYSPAGNQVVAEAIAKGLSLESRGSIS